MRSIFWKSFQILTAHSMRISAVDLRVLDLMRTGHSKNSKPSRSVVLHAGIWHWPDSILALAFPLSALPDQSNGRTRP
jgi:hypothetical protein